MGCPSVMPSVITLESTDGVIPSVMFPRETFFWHARIRLYFCQCFRRWVVFLFATELVTEMGFTDDCYTDGRDPSVTPSVLFLPTEFIAVTNGIGPSVKLDNVVVYHHILHHFHLSPSACMSVSFHRVPRLVLIITPCAWTPSLTMTHLHTYLNVIKNIMFFFMVIEPICELIKLNLFFELFK